MMQLNDPGAYRLATDEDIIRQYLDLPGKQVLELGCGGAWMTRLLAGALGAAKVVATEVDRRQHEKNLAMEGMPDNIEFRFGGAQSIAATDASFDCVFMFKSLHHVPSEQIVQSLREIHRVLRPGGIAYFSEPVYEGDFNDIIRLFHDEKVVRQQAFEHLREAVQTGLFTLEREIFINVPGTYATWEIFEERFLNVTHTEHQIDASLYARIQAAFLAHMKPEGAYFLKPHRIDLLRR
jgi:ubiquinone/menaquinone biosynthesis C-methylase UbiE